MKDSIKNMTVGIIGLGRFGELVEKILNKNLPKIRIITFGRKETGTNSNHNSKRIAECDVITICVPISSFKEVVGNISHFIRPATLIIDVCSVKMFPVKVMKELLPKKVEIIASHPLFGPDSFKDNNKLKIVVWPVRCSKRKFSEFKKTCSRLGISPIIMSPQKHDKIMAFSQLFVHLVGRLAQDVDIKPSQINTKSFELLLQIKKIVCNDSQDLFIDMNRFNPFSEEMLNATTKSLTKIKKLIRKDS